MKLCVLLVSASVALMLSPAVQAAPGDLDTTFGAGGKVTTDFGGSADRGLAVALQTDGKVVVAGHVVLPDGSSRIGLARYNVDGGLDTTFGQGGRVISSAAEILFGRVAVAVQADGKILVGGSISTGFSVQGVLARYDTSGTLDPSFGLGGLAFTHTGRLNGLFVAPDGRILVVGGGDANNLFAVTRLLSNGLGDGSFGFGGTAEASFGSSVQSAFDVAVQADGKIVVSGIAGDGPTGFAVARFDSAGELDPGFGSNGTVVVTFARPFSVWSTLAFQADGRIVVAGRSVGEAEGDIGFALFRLTSSGGLDQTFGDDGRVAIPLSGFSDDVLTQADGRILAAGSISSNADSDFAAVRYQPDGSLDSTFGNGGIARADFGGPAEIASAAVATPAGIVLAGSVVTATQDFGVVRFLAPTAVPFASFEPRLRVRLHRGSYDDELELKARFALGTDSNGIAPVTELVRIAIGALDLRLPPGSFTDDKKGRFTFVGILDGTNVEAVLRSKNKRLFEFDIEARRLELGAIPKDVRIALTIGDDEGAAETPVRR